jgi:cytidylate kinase
MPILEREAPVNKEVVSRNDFIVAIDGPSGSGKEALAHRLADRYNLTFINTGIAVRALALLTVEKGLVEVHGDDVTYPPNFTQLASSLYEGVHNTIKFIKNPNSADHTAFCMVDGRDVHKELIKFNNQAVIEKISSSLAPMPDIRTHLYEVWRNAKKELGGAVVVGRKTGVDLFPEAQLKLYLYADPELSALYRLQKHISAMKTANDEKGYVLNRDKNDWEHGLLERPLDALTIDVTKYLPDDEGLDMLAKEISAEIDEKYELV